MFETKNNAENVINSLEKMMKESNDKITDEDKAALQEAIDKCKKDIESDDVEQIRKALEELSSSSSGIISKLYAQAASEAKNEETAAGGDDDVIIEDKDDKDNK